MAIYYEIKKNGPYSAELLNSGNYRQFMHSNQTNSFGYLKDNKSSAMETDTLEIIYWRKNSHVTSDITISALEQCETKADFSRLMNKNTGWDALILFSKKLNALIIVQNHTAFPDLYYYSGDHIFMISDDLHEIRANPFVKLDQINQKGVNQFLYFYYITKSESIVKQVKKLESAEMLVLDQLFLSKTTYWHPVAKNEKISFSEAVSRWSALIQNSVKKRLSNTIENALFLSGGIDSSLIAAIIREQDEKQPLLGLTTGIKKSKHDETAMARISAKKYQIDHQVDMIGSGVIKKLPQILWNSQEPYADRSILGMFNLGSFLPPTISSIFSGDGEGIGMQYSVKRWRTKKYQKMVPCFLRNTIMPKLPDLFQKAMNNKLISAIKKTTRYGHENVYHIFNDGGLFNPFEIGELTGNALDFMKDVANFDDLAFTDYDDLNFLQNIGLNTYCYSDYLKRSSVFQKIYDITVENPFLDKALIQFMFSVPHSIKYDKTEIKPLTRAVARQYLPKKIINGKKRGWYIPATQWLQTEYEPLTKQFVGHDLLERNIFDPIKLKQLLNSFFHQGNNGYKIMMLFFLETWFKVCWDQTISPDQELHLHNLG